MSAFSLRYSQLLQLARTEGSTAEMMLRVRAAEPDGWHCLSWAHTSPQSQRHWCCDEAGRPKSVSPDACHSLTRACALRCLQASFRQWQVERSVPQLEEQLAAATAAREAVVVEQEEEVRMTLERQAHSGSPLSFVNHGYA
jgi:hypothetical protein